MATAAPNAMWPARTIASSNNTYDAFEALLFSLAHAHVSEIEDLQRRIRELHIQKNPLVDLATTPKGASDFPWKSLCLQTPPASPRRRDEPSWSSRIHGTEIHATEYIVTVTASPDEDPGHSCAKAKRVSLDDDALGDGSDAGIIENLPPDPTPTHSSRPSFGTVDTAETSDLNVRRSSTSEIDIDKLRQAQCMSEKISGSRGVELSRGASSEAIQKQFKGVVSSFHFEVFFAFVIVTNAVFIGVRVEACADCPHGASIPFRAIEYSYAALFASELLLRLAAGGFAVLCKEGCLWYWLDLFVVGASAVEVVLDFSEDQGGSITNLSHLRMFRVVRVVRILKVVRIARVVRYVRALRVLALSILHTMRSVLWAFVLLFMIIYVFGLVFVQVVRDHLRQGSGSHVDASLELYWGTLPRSMLTLYKCVTNGISWHEVVTPLGDVDGISVAIFMVYISFTVFAVLNVITGVFCEAAIESARQDYEMMIQQHLKDKDAFVEAINSLFGVDKAKGDAVLTYGEFEAVLMDPKCKAQLAVMELDSADAWELFKLLDRDESNLIDVEEFISGCLRLKGLAKAIDVAKLAYEGKLRQKKTLKYLELLEKKLNKVMHHMYLDRKDSKGEKTNSTSITRPSSTPGQTSTPKQLCSRGSLSPCQHRGSS